MARIHHHAESAPCRVGVRVTRRDPLRAEPGSAPARDPPLILIGCVLLVVASLPLSLFGHHPPVARGEFFADSGLLDLLRRKGGPHDRTG